MSQQQRNALPIGERLQNYRIEGILGSGGFGITYMGVESVTERKVAIKEFMPSNIAVRDRDSRSIQPISETERDDFEWGLDRFRQEAKVLITLINPNIVPVLNYFEANGTGYLVMAYQEGDSLSALLRPDKTLAQSEIDEILLPILDGLQAIHDAGFLHRDIKPDNIFIRNDGTPVIIDFGSARLALSQHTRGLTAIVSEGYAPFEQYQNDGNQGPWSDIYALGGTLYRCITGRRPVEATARIAAAAKGSDDPLKPVGELAGPGYRATLLTSIDRSLAVDEAARPQDAAAFRALLAGEAVPEAAGATLLAGATPASETMLVGGAAAAAGPQLTQAPDKTLSPDAGVGKPTGATITGASAASATVPVAQNAKPKARRKLLWPAVAAGILIAGGASAYVAIEQPWKDQQIAAVKTGNDGQKTQEQKEAEAKRMAEEKRQQAEAQRKAEEEARRKAAEAEAQRKAEEAKRQAADAEARRKAAEEEARRKAADAEAQRKAEEAKRQAAEEEARRKAAEAEAQRKAEEARRQAADAEAKRQAEAEAKRQAEAEAKRQAEARRKAALEAQRKAALEAQRRKAQEDRKNTQEARRKALEERRKRLEARRKAAEERRKKQLAARNTGGVAKYLPGRRVSYQIQSGRGEEEWRMTIRFSAGGRAFMSCNYQDFQARYGACEGYYEGAARWTARGSTVCVRFRGGKQHCFSAIKRGNGYVLSPRVRGARLLSFR